MDAVVGDGSIRVLPKVEDPAREAPERGDGDEVCGEAVEIARVRAVADADDVLFRGALLWILARARGAAEIKGFLVADSRLLRH